MHNQSSIQKQQERGAVAIFAAIAAVVLLGLGAMAIDVGYGLVTRSELQNASDSGSHAGTRELARIYKGLGNTYWKEYTLTSSDKARILQAVNTYAAQNEAASKSIGIPAGDVSYGRWDKATGELAETSTGVTSVHVKARRDEVANGAVSTILASVIGHDTMEVAADSASGISALGKLPAGKGEIPVGIAKAWFTARDSPCGTNSEVVFYPTGTTNGCAGWHTFTEYPANAAKLRNILRGLEARTYESPETVAGATYYNFTGGTVATNFSDMKSLYNARKNASGVWKVLIPVYDYASCANVSGSVKIVGFASARITAVIESPAKEIRGNVECGIVDIGEGGGDDYGTLVGIPQIVQ